MADVEQRVKNVISEQLGVAVDDLKPESHINNDLGADYLDDVELIMDLEDEFDIEIPDEVAEELRTVGAIVEYVRGRVPE
jgi:acyl carrier protein